MKIIQPDDYTCSTDGDTQLSVSECFPLTCMRRRQIDSDINEIEVKAFMTINAFIGWFGIIASPLCAFYSSYLQQKIPTAKVSVLVSQYIALKTLKRYGTFTAFTRPLLDLLPQSI